MLKRLTGPLCDALTGRDDGFQMLDRLERSNLFLQALDQSRRWFRYHALFADFLQARLERFISGARRSFTMPRLAGWRKTASVSTRSITRFPPEITSLQLGSSTIALWSRYAADSARL